MDRFEVFTYVMSHIIFKIYIPVWIDLKDELLKHGLKFKEIYIPVWIDLKL